MELKNTEQTVDDLLERYRATRRGLLQLNHNDNHNNGSSSYESAFPELAPRIVDSDHPESAADAVDDDADDGSVLVLSLSELVASLQHIQSQLGGDLQVTMTKFRKRLWETDPVTGNPRYGEKTQQRVSSLVAAYDRLCQVLPPPPSSSSSSSSSSPASSASMSIEVLMELSTKVQNEAKEQARQEALELERQQKLEQERREREEEALRQQQAQAEQERQERVLQEQRANELLRQRAEQARRQRLERESADQRWAESIGRGPDAVKAQLKILKEATASDPEAQKVALASLLQLFSQIQKFPEEVNYRRIRRSHEQFQQDIGRHKGGQEVLIAAGFEPGAIDDVPCFICREPDLEKEMDKWSEWFDLLKSTHQILQEEQL